jgi:hypothetical protein
MPLGLFFEIPYSLFVSNLFTYTFLTVPGFGSMVPDIVIDTVEELMIDETLA